MIEFINIITGLVIIGCGYTVKSNPKICWRLRRKKLMLRDYLRNLIVQGIAIVVLSALFDFCV